MVNKSFYYYKQVKSPDNKKNYPVIFTGFFALIVIVFAFSLNLFFPLKLLSPVVDRFSNPVKSSEAKATHEVFGFAPFWTLNKLNNIDFSVLTTLAYFGLPIQSNGEIDEEYTGTKMFYSDKATALFKKAHDNGTKVVATITQMDNDDIKNFLDSKEAQNTAIKETINIVKARGLDGVNIDFEYVGNPGGSYKKKFSNFVANFTKKMHKEIPYSKITVSVYASSAKFEKLYDIASISKNSDGIFMMAYDFATSGSDTAIPTAPLYGYKEGKYWYDISTAVDDFLKVMPKEKLILGLPWYGYNYPVANPQVKAEKDYGYYTYYWWRGRKYSQFIPREGAYASTYSKTLELTADVTGWDDHGKVSWHAYNTSDGWRMIFMEDEKSLSLKYDFAKEKGLGGVGMWALGFDDGKGELWRLLARKFGKTLAAKI